MLKYTFLISAIFYSAVILISPSHASDFKLIVHDFACEEDEVVIHYSVINYINFDRPDVSIVFKIMKEKKPIACNELITTIYKRDDGSEVKEFIIDLRCEEGAVNLESDIFHDEIQYSKEDRIDQFFTGCPGINK